MVHFMKPLEHSYGLRTWCDGRVCRVDRREKLAATEVKLKTAVQDKNNANIEKAALERELKGLRGQAGRLTKVPPLVPFHHKLLLPAEGIAWYRFSMTNP
jgi:hypothetical protein